MTRNYDHAFIEAKWQKSWEDSGLNRTSEDSQCPKWFALAMLPYPSGDLHIGHWYAMTPADTVARFKRMRGYNVFFPIGFDAFGLPAENAAIKHGVHPREWTYSNIKTMRRQLRQMGAMWAWDREVVTCEPGYYKWSQWLFLRLLDADLAYRDLAEVDWCPSCNTTLAREQVKGSESRCERCETPVIRKELEQWKYRITRYSDELLQDLSELDWPDPVKTMQTNWIGRSVGASVTFLADSGDPIEVFTTRPDTLWGATFIVLAPEHPLVRDLTTPDRLEEVSTYTAQLARTGGTAREYPDRTKTGEFLGSFAVNPVNGRRIPIWVADYVTMNYGTGAIMAVPGHDERDLEFARQFGLDILRVISGPDGDTGPIQTAWTSQEEGSLINSGQFDGTPVRGAAPKVAEWLRETGKGRKEVKYRLHDWAISRQRMWGTPIPIVYCKDCGTVPVPYEDLPVILPEQTEIPASGENALNFTPSFLKVLCPRCQRPALRETDTMDTFMCSSWYQYAYVSPYWRQDSNLRPEDIPWDKAKGDYWLPVDQYTGGIEHATMHLLYTRFFTKAMRDLGILNFDEPMLRLFNQGMILGGDNEKMSKSRGNVLGAEQYVDEYGSDALRGHLMFIGPWDQGGSWDSQRISGIRRFLERVWTVSMEPIATEEEDSAQNDALERIMHETIRRLTDDLEKFRFNTALAALMEFTNHLSKLHQTRPPDTALWQEAVDVLCLLMAPFFPHISEEIWQQNGHEGSVHRQAWPDFDPRKLKAEMATIPVQVNGRLRATLIVQSGVENSELEALAMAHPSVRAHIRDGSIQKVIIVPNKVVNFVV